LEPGQVQTGQAEGQGGPTETRHPAQGREHVLFWRGRWGSRVHDLRLLGRSSPRRRTVDSLDASDGEA
ncbi:hypothetical protein HN235_18910, partial [Acinetobacter baumannii]|uniref:hypothetical protein n=1 Tax=Acinetobacter baumannii TaxID=470 RepID=UPI00189C467B